MDDHRAGASQPQQSCRLGPVRGVGRRHGPRRLHLAGPARREELRVDEQAALLEPGEQAGVDGVSDDGPARGEVDERAVRRGVVDDHHGEVVEPDLLPSTVPTHDPDPGPQHDEGRAPLGRDQGQLVAGDEGSGGRGRGAHGGDAARAAAPVPGVLHRPGARDAGEAPDDRHRLAFPLRTGRDQAGGLVLVPR